MAVQAEVEKIKVRRSPQRLIPFLTPEELKIFLQQPDITKRNGLRDMVFLSLMYDTAARCQEMVDLKLSDIDLKKGCVYITGKGDKTRVVYRQDFIGVIADKHIPDWAREKLSELSNEQEQTQSDTPKMGM